MRILYLSSCIGLLLFLILPYKNGHAFQLSQQSELSLLTCSPGNEAYSVYGHSAIRVKDSSNGIDLVYNYGIFDFSAPNFIYRFAKGQTDYLLGAYGFSGFVEEYVSAQRSIYEQVLNLTQDEKQQIFDFLAWNALPENRVYRYNFFFDNCATRIRDVIESHVDGSVVFPEYADVQKTFRDLIKEYHSKIRWLDFGIDLVVSSPSDNYATAYDEMFLPDYLMIHFDNTNIKNGNKSRALVKSAGVVYNAPEITYSEPKVFSPFIVFVVLFLFVAGISFKQLYKREHKYLTDYLLLGITGFMGIVMMWFMIFSEHPAMYPNFNVLWALPFNLMFILLWKVKKWRHISRYYFPVATGWYLLVIPGSFLLPQRFHVVFFLIMLMVLCRLVLQTFLTFRLGKQAVA